MDRTWLGRICKLLGVGLAIPTGAIVGLLLVEVAYRFYLFGFPLHYRDVRASYQDRGIVDPHWMPDGKRRLAFVGDSFTAGWPMSVYHSYPVLLERQLARKDITIANFAVPDTNRDDQMEIIKEIASLKPHVVVWGLSTNDVIIAGPRRKTTFEEIMTAQGKKFIPTSSLLRHAKRAVLDLPYDCLVVNHMSLLSTVKEVLSTYSYAYVAIKTRLAHVRSLDRFRAKTDVAASDTGLGSTLLNAYLPTAEFDELFDVIASVQDFLSERSIDFMLLYVPQEFDVSDRVFEDAVRQLGTDPSQYDRHHVKRSIEAFCLTHGVTFIDPSDAMERELRRGGRLFLNFDLHYNLAGSMFMANFLTTHGAFLSHLH